MDHSECRNALERALCLLSPPDGIAYLLWEVIPDYWIPVAVSEPGVLEEVPYYKVGYSLIANDLRSGRQTINDDLQQLVRRGKLEALLLTEPPFFQEVLHLRDEVQQPHVIVRASRKQFADLDCSIRAAFGPLIGLILKSWGQLSLQALQHNPETEQRLEIGEIVQKIADQLSDKHRFPPYYLLTDYVIEIHINHKKVLETVCSNPLGYSLWIRNDLGKSPPPWIPRMAEMPGNYLEDLLSHKGLTPEQARSYDSRLNAMKGIGRRLAEELADDVRRVATIASESPGVAPTTFWARHNRPKANLQRASSDESTDCKSFAEALRQLLKDRHERDDFLVTLWAARAADQEPLAVHVGCESAYRHEFTESSSDVEGDQGWKEVAYPDVSSDGTTIRIRYQSTDFGSADVDTKIKSVLEAAHHEVMKLHEAPEAIHEFWNGLKATHESYTPLFKKFTKNHRLNWWKNEAPEQDFRKLAASVIRDMSSISHLSSWKGLGASKFEPNLRSAYVHLARVFRDLRLPAELVEFVFEKEPLKRAQPEYIDVEMMRVESDDEACEQFGNLMQSFWFLHHKNGWQLDALGYDPDIGRFVVRLSHPAGTDSDPEKFFYLASNCFVMPEGEGKSELRSAYLNIRKIASRFGVLIEGWDRERRYVMHCEFAGGLVPENEQ